MTSQHRGSVRHLLHFREHATIAISQAARDRAVDRRAVFNPSGRITVDLILFEISMSSRATPHFILGIQIARIKKSRRVLSRDDRRKTRAVSSRRQSLRAQFATRKRQADRPRA